MPKYVAPEPKSPLPPGFGEGLGDRWFAAEQGIENLLGQAGPGAPGVVESWQRMLRGADYLGAKTRKARFRPGRQPR
jgi:hypothetical protein